MARICVIGGGSAGAEAAREAARGGAEVTILERLDRLEPPWRSWPALIDGSQSAGEAPGSSRHLGGPAASVLVKDVKFAAPGSVETVDGVSVRCDSVVAATGCGSEPVFLPGHRKPGVLVLDAMSRYAELGRMRSSIGACVVMGEGPRSLQVADRLSGGGRRVRLLVSGWQNYPPDPSVLAAMERSAADSGVSMTQGAVSKAVGSGSLEAVVVGGDVVSCGALVVVPRRVPRVAPTQARLGQSGALVVDRTLRTSIPAMYAAGGCAELEGGFPHPTTLEGEAAMSGRTAGANSAGLHLSVDMVGFSGFTVFGLRWTRAGLGVSPARARGLDVETVSHRWGTTSACAIVYERLTGRVVGVESVEKANASPAETPSLASASVSLRTLAYGGLCGSTDISLVSDTARLGLRHWSRS